MMVQGKQDFRMVRGVRVQDFRGFREKRRFGDSLRGVQGNRTLGVHGKGRSEEIRPRIFRGHL